MKRFFAFIAALLLCLLAGAAGAEHAPFFPAKGENGKWGYIDRQGRFVIPAQFDYAFEFRGNYAEVVLFPEDWTGSRNVYDGGHDGIIDRSGALVLPPEYNLIGEQDESWFGGRDTGIWCVLGTETEGFFDIPSGYFSGLKWHNVYQRGAKESRLIPVIDETYRAGSADLSTGELVIPCLYESVDPSSFAGGVAAVCPIPPETEDEPAEDEEETAYEFILIDETGAEIPLPEGIHAVRYEGAHENRVVVVDDHELYGYADAAGNLIIPPQFACAKAFEGGFAVVRFPEDDWGCVDPDGRVLVRGLAADHWDGPKFRNGMYTRRTAPQTFSVIDLQGKTVMTFSTDNLEALYPPNSRGLCLFAEATDSISGVDYGFVDLTGWIVVDAELGLDWFQEPSEGLLPVWRKADGIWMSGYMDESGQMVLPPVYDAADDFDNGLARVWIGNRCGYIDHDGQEVYFWNEEEEE